MAQLRHVRIRETTVDKTIQRLEVFVSRMERRYERSSAEMLDDVASGRTRETAEVSRWLADYQALIRLRAHQAPGLAIG